MTKHVSSNFHRKKWKHYRQAFICPRERLPVIGETPEDIKSIDNSPKIYNDPAPEQLPWKLSKVIPGHLDCVTCISVDHRNRCFVTGSSDRTVKLWKLTTGTLIASFRAHKGTVRALAFSEKFPLFFTCGDDGLVKSWNVEYHKSVTHFRGHLTGVKSLALHSDYNMFISGDKNGSCRIWDIRTRDTIRVLEGHSSGITKILIPRTHKQVITSSLDTTIKMWDFESTQCIRTLTNHRAIVRDLVMDPNQDAFISGANDSVKQWQYPDGNFVQALRGQDTCINYLAVSLRGVLVAAGVRGNMDFWNLNGYNQSIEGMPVPSATLINKGSVFSLAFDNSGSKLITGGGDQTIKIYTNEEMMV